MKRVLLVIDTYEEYTRKLLQGLSNYSRGKKWSFIRMPLSFKEKHGISGLISWIDSWKPDCVIAQLHSKNEVEAIAGKGIPLFTIDTAEHFAVTSTVTGGYIETGEMAAAYFFSKGYVNFAFYGFSSHIWSCERKKGYVSYLEQRGYSVMVYEVDSHENTHVWYYDEKKVNNWLNVLPKPIALFCCDDNQAHHIREVCLLYGYTIPSDVSILGVDDDRTICCLSEPFLSSIQLNVQKAGEQLGECINKSMKTKQKQKKIDVIVSPLSVMSRQSTDILATHDEMIAKVLTYIHSHSADSLKVDDLVALVPLSRRSLEKRFRRVTLESVYSYICKQRIQKVCDAFMVDSRSIQVIAAEFGFPDVTNFARLFKKYKGVTPSVYRAQLA